MSFSEDIKKPFNIITLTIAIISIGLTIYFYVEGIKEKSICYKIEHNPSLIFDNEKIKKLLNSRDGDTYCRVWFQLLALAAKCNAHGAVLLGENIPITIDDLARIMNKTVNKLATIMQQLVNLHMIFVEEGTIYIKNWDVYQNLDKLEKIKEDNRKRQQRFRDKQMINNVTVTLDNAEDKNREEKIRIENDSGFKD